MAQLLVVAVAGDLSMIEACEQQSMLVLAAEAQCPTNLVLTLIEKGADKEGKNDDGETALLVASGWRDYDGIMALLNHGANVNAVDVNNKTVLDVAVYRKGESDEQRTLLVEKGVCTKVVDDAEIVAKVEQDVKKEKEECTLVKKDKKRINHGQTLVNRCNRFPTCLELLWFALTLKRGSHSFPVRNSVER